ncbi:PEP-CTERM sorting domain-containing protein [Planctomycetales bacterium ZRK34]|nr:PEP-CTERM sorting domain-containing protein [Planctomycetales bacterium ZRK34]
MFNQMGRVIAVVCWLAIVGTLTNSTIGDTITITLDSGEIGSYMSEGTRVPTDTFGGIQYNRSEFFAGYNDSSDLLSLRPVLGFNIDAFRTGLPSGAHIDDVILTLHANTVNNGAVQGLEVWASTQDVVESEVDWDVYSSGNAWSPAFVRGASTGLGAQLSSTTDSYAANTSHDISLSDTTGNFVSTLETAIDNPGQIYTLIVSSLTTEAGAINALLRLASDDAGSNRPTLTVDYTPIRQLAAAEFEPTTQTVLDFESLAAGYLDTNADNPTTNTYFTSNGVTSVSATAATNQSDEQNQNTPNGKGLFYVGGTVAYVDGTEGRFAILDDDNADGLSELSEFRMDGGPTYTIDFESVQDQFGVTFIDQAGQTMTFTFYLDGVEQGAFDLAVGNISNDFYGARTPFEFNRVSISGANDTDGWGLGEIRFALIPEPATFATFALGALALLRRRTA